MNIENQKIIMPYGDNASRRLTGALIEEFSMLLRTSSGRFEGVGSHDDLVMSLALANAASQGTGGQFILLDDLDIFDEPITTRRSVSGVMGINF